MTLDLAMTLPSTRLLGTRICQKEKAILAGQQPIGICWNSQMTAWKVSRTA